MVIESLSRCTVRCRQGFQACLNASNTGSKEWLTNRLADFDLWANGIGATLSNHSSLEYRVRERPDVRDVFIGLLRRLQDALGDYESNCE